MAKDRGSIDWLRVVVHGVIGAAFGATTGFGAWVFGFNDAYVSAQTNVQVWR